MPKKHISSPAKVFVKKIARQTWSTGLLVALFFGGATLAVISFSGPPAGCTPASCPENPLHIDFINSRVGIGTTGSPSEKLEVNGNIKASAFFYLSDFRLKKDLQPIDASLSKISALNGYSFTWRKNEQKDMGVIAQEVEKIFPELVHMDSNGMKSVEYGNLVAPLIESVKELKAITDRQNTKISELQAEIFALSRK